jgi:S1-C subfamily serine protease
VAALAVEDVITKVGGRRVSTAEEAVAATETVSGDVWDALEIVRPGSVR